jgi:hypothetical protein
MKMHYVKVDGMNVPVCDECIQGTHMTYGYNHMDFDNEERGGCKNISDDGQSQCNCHKEWPELQAAIGKELSCKDTSCGKTDSAIGA